MEKVTREDVLAYVDCKAGNDPSQQANGLARVTIKKHLSVIRKVFDTLVSQGVIACNPAEAIPLRNVPARTRDIKVFTPNEVAEISRAVRPKWMADVILLAYRTGLRRGEIFGLQWEDIDFERKILRVRRSVGATTPGQRIVKEPKTRSSERNVALDTQTIEMLSRRMGDALPDTVWVVENQYGKPISPWYVTKYMRDACIKAEIAPRGIHTLRHTHATMLLAAGVYVKIVQERLGHANIATTLGTYAHTMPSMQEEAVRVFESLG